MFTEWLSIFVNEKGFDLDHVFEVEGPVWGTNWIPLEVVIDTILSASISYLTPRPGVKPAERHLMELVINFSGGKDSSAMLAYICENWPDAKKHVVFADTGWEHDDAIQWSESIVNRFGLPLHVVRNPNKDFFSMVRNRGMFPSPGQRQCTSDLKRGPIQTWIRRNCADTLIVNCMGLRADESPARAKKLQLTRNKTMTNSKRTMWDWLPIHNWSEAQVRGYLADRNIPLHPVYSYLNRFSCQVCIYMTQRDLRAVKEHNPLAFQRVADLEIEIGFTMQPGATIVEKSK